MTVRVLLICGVLLTARAEALPGDALQGVELGQSADSAQSALKTSLGAVEALAASEPKALAEGLLRSDFLAALNRAGAKHTLLKDPSARHVLLLRAGSGSARVVVGTAAGVVEAVFLRIAVKPDRAVGAAENAFTAARLAPIRKVISDLESSGCSLAGEPSGKNVFVRRGACGQAHVYVEYRPADDEYWIVYSG